MGLFSNIRRAISVYIRDVPRHLASIKAPSPDYLTISNSSDNIDVNECQRVKVEGDYTSELASAKYYPALANTLMMRAVGEYPIGFKTEYEPSQQPAMSVIIGHRGSTTLPNLLATLSTFAAQVDSNVEVIVVEQDHTPQIKEHLPTWVRYLFIKIPLEQSKYNRSWAFNVGVRHAKASIVLLHDNDLLVPQTYCKAHVEAINLGFHVANLKRFIFYCTETSTRLFFTNTSQSINDLKVESVLQNARGGGSLAVRREFYLSIGGFDEDFIGWGGEDNEFWQRCESGNIDYYGYLPLVHLWHPSQPGKRAINGQGADTASLTQKKMVHPIIKRIEVLCNRDFGSPAKYE